MFENFMGIPAHPLFVHGAAVFAPVAALLVLVWMFVRTPRGFHILSGAATALSLFFVFLARSSGEALLVMQGHSEDNPGPLADHVLWANVMTAAVIVMAAGLIAFVFVQVNMNNKAVVVLCRVVVIIAAVALLVSAALAGHAGATQVWNM